MDRLELSIETVWVGSVVILSLYNFRIVRSPRGVAVSSGVLCASGVVLTLVGVALLPVTVVTLAWMIGFLGLVPFGMAWMLLRAAREAWSGSAILPPRQRLGLGTSGAALAVLLPFGHPIAQQVSYEVAFWRLDLATPDAVVRANEALDWVPCLSPQPLLDEALWENDDARMDRLSQLCELRFGFSIGQ